MSYPPQICFLRLAPSILFPSEPPGTFRLYYDLTEEALGEGLDDFPQLSLKLLADGALPLDGAEELGLIGPEVGEEVRLPLENVGDGDVVEEAFDTSEDKRNHLVNSHGRILLLLEELGQLW